MTLFWQTFRVIFLAGGFVACILFPGRMIAGEDAFNPYEAAMPIGSVGKQASTLWPRPVNPLHVVVVFTKWKGEAPGQTTAPEYAKELFNGQPGSVDDYFNTVSFGQFQVSGEYLPKMYEMPDDSTYYNKSTTYAQDIIKILDEDKDVSLAKFDNDGLDGIPNSGDDDGFVDYLILVPMSRPYNFILKLATGVMSLPLPAPYITHELRPYGGDPVIVDAYSGCLVVASWKRPALGTIVAEISHAFGALDLMDKEYSLPEIDSAGVGYWDMLGWGATGWGGTTGIPVGPCAFNRMQMSSIGPGNSNLVDLYGSRKGVRISEVGGVNGTVYRAWLKTDEYFLIEFRSNESSLFYDNQLPGSGLAIWHVMERESNSTEESKLCDLECADGLYRDKGYPLGEYPDTSDKNGRDNLDFWSHDTAYTVEHAGNMGDATDLFDGVKYTEFSDSTNPRSRANSSAYPSGINIFNIHREGNEMVFDCNINYNPIMKPPKLPQLGLAYQRSRDRSVVQSEAEKAVYLVQYGRNAGVDMVVTVSGDVLKIQKTEGFGTLELQRILEAGLFSPETTNALITRENITAGEFGRILREYDLQTGDLNAGKIPVRVQKATISGEADALPFVMYIRQNSPNPFNGESVISFILSAPGQVTLEVYNVLGQKVLERDHGRMEAGSHAVTLSSGGLSSGVYFYRFHGAPVSQTRRLMILR